MYVFSIIPVHVYLGCADVFRNENYTDICIEIELHSYDTVVYSPILAKNGTYVR